MSGRAKIRPVHGYVGHHQITQEVIPLSRRAGRGVLGTRLHAFYLTPPAGLSAGRRRFLFEDENIIFRIAGSILILQEIGRFITTDDMLYVLLWEQYTNNSIQFAFSHSLSQ